MEINDDEDEMRHFLVHASRLRLCNANDGVYVRKMILLNKTLAL